MDNPLNKLLNQESREHLLSAFYFLFDSTNGILLPLLEVYFTHLLHRFQPLALILAETFFRLTKD